MVKCPVCAQEMEQKTESGVTLDVCPSHGVWLDQKELFLITERKRHEEGSFTLGDVFRREQFPRVDESRRLDCPHCGREMRLEPYRNVFMDWCPEHGVWLDAGELDAILNNLRLDPVFLHGVALRLDELRY